MKTHHAPADRSKQEEIEYEHKRFTDEDFIVAIAQASSGLFVILNKNRQIVLSNNQLLQLLSLENDSVIGKRPGEAFNCIHAKHMDAGCGTSKFCSECGAVKAIMTAINGEKAEEECRLTSEVKDKKIAHDLLVKAEPFLFKNENYVLFSVADISDSKRRELLEKTFFHDVLNTAGGIYGFSMNLTEIMNETEAEHSDSVNIIHNLSDALVNEIKAYQQLVAAEMSTLETKIEEINVKNYLQMQINLVSKNIETGNVKVILQECDEITLKSDRMLLQRVLLNMMKNAVEASEDGQEVTVKAKLNLNKTLFSVHSHKYMAESVQRQIFQRSFSTKGNSRGIGTYSMKMFGEEYLHGKVWFTTDELAGTTFYLEI